MHLLSIAYLQWNLANLNKALTEMQGFHMALFISQEARHVAPVNQIILIIESGFA